VRSSRWFKGALVAVLVAVPVAFAVAQQRAVRHSAVSCFQTVGLSYTVYADLYAGSSATMHDWGIASKWQPGSLSSLEGSTVFCPVTLDVPRADGTPIEKIRIIYSTREANIPGANVANFEPKINTCSVYLMDGSEDGTWFTQTAPGTAAGENTGNLFNDGEINIEGGLVPLGSETLRRMLITCQLPRAVSVSGVTTYTGMIKGYEVQYTESPPTTPPPPP